ncbi:GNAT family N-acetyltransferase [Rubrivirga sp.]|uniref:GNAT family N-acetyltransferase n=1 Tax=Rubrivirga sp. TaxID=1885344 RepID=UPI003C71DB32
MMPARRRPTMDTPAITFRPLLEDDLPTMHLWLNDPAVVEWWEGDDVTWPAVVSDYGPGHGDPVEHWIADLEGEPMGWIQCYTAADLLEEETWYWRDHLDVESTAGIDYLVGKEHRGRGLGSAMIRAFVRDVVFPSHPEWARAAAGPFQANVGSWKALEKAGFTQRAVLEDEEGDCVLMVMERVDLEAEPERPASRSVDNRVTAP